MVEYTFVNEPIRKFVIQKYSLSRSSLYRSLAVCISKIATITNSRNKSVKKQVIFQNLWMC